MAARLLLLLGLVATASPGAAPFAAPAVHTVTIDATSYSPATLTIKAGDTVVWVNKDIVAHTATAENAFDSGRIDPGKKWQRKFPAKGDFSYQCRYHVGMTGTLTVK